MAKKLSRKERDLIRDDVQSAIFHLLSCWDALFSAEQIFGSAIEVEDISGVASNFSEPESVVLDADDLDAILESAKERAHA